MDSVAAASALRSSVDVELPIHSHTLLFTLAFVLPLFALSLNHVVGLVGIEERPLRIGQCRSQCLAFGVGLLAQLRLLAQLTVHFVEPVAAHRHALPNDMHQ